MGNNTALDGLGEDACFDWSDDFPDGAVLPFLNSPRAFGHEADSI